MDLTPLPTALCSYIVSIFYLYIFREKKNMVVWLAVWASFTGSSCWTIRRPAGPAHRHAAQDQDVALPLPLPLREPSQAPAVESLRLILQSSSHITIKIKSDGRPCTSTGLWVVA
jgi:hypothetical protein